MYDVVVVGGGLSGLVAALEAKRNGSEVLILERSNELGGKLLLYSGESCQTKVGEYSKKCGDVLTGIVNEIHSEGIEVMYGRHVEDIKKKEQFRIYTGLEYVDARAIVFATGTKDKTRFTLNIPGDRVSGVFTESMALELVADELIIGKNVAILSQNYEGINTAKMLLEHGISVLGVFEEKVEEKNVNLEIPVYYGARVTEIRGKGRVERIRVSIDGKSQWFSCDTLVISAGRIPNAKMFLKLKAEMLPSTKGPVVKGNMESSVTGIFACGSVVDANCDFDCALQQAKTAGKAAADFARR